MESHAVGAHIAAQPATSSESASYACSKCGFQANLPDPDWHDPALPVWSKRGAPPAECYELCPEDGPDDAWLIEPNSRSFRERQTYDLPTGPVRACIPTMVLRRINGRVTAGPVIGIAEVWRDLYRCDYLKRHGFDHRINLQRAVEARNLISDWHVGRLTGAWGLALPLGKGMFLDDDWLRRIDVLRARDPKAKALSPSMLASALHADPKSHEDALARTLFIPVDLEQAVGPQLRERGAQAVEIQKYLYRFTKKAPSRDRDDNLWRDLYIYYLRETTSKTIAQIAEEVFAGHEQNSAIAKVKQILRRVRRAIAKAGLRRQ